METKNMIYLVSEYASQGEIFGKLTLIFQITLKYLIKSSHFLPKNHSKSVFLSVYQMTFLNVTVEW